MSRHKIVGETADKKFAKNTRPKLSMTERVLKAYEKPLLISYGDVRDITVGGSQNPGDPGVPASTRRN